MGLLTQVSQAAEASTPEGAKIVRILFKQGNPQGSFDAGPSAGLLPKPGTGHPAKRLFNADGSLLATSTTDSKSSSWPKWLSRVELGISGTANTAAIDPACARFAGPAEQKTDGTCNFDNDDGTTPAVSCGAPSGVFRVSERDCVKGTPALKGNGGPGDGVYIRVNLDRSATAIGPKENLMMTLEYSATALNRPPQTPDECFKNGKFNPESGQCADMVWNLYLKHSAYEIVQPFLMFMPPAVSYVDTTAPNGGQGGGQVTTKQFFIPLASDPQLQVIQLSRITALSATSTDFYERCNGVGGDGANGANSPHCVGLVLYSLTLFRM